MVNHMKHHVSYRLAAVAWAVILLVISLQPARPGNIHSGPAHHIAHFFGFGALALLSAMGLGFSDRNSVYAGLASFSWGMMIEYLQHAHNQVPIEWYDVRDNSLGIIAFMILWHSLYRRIDGLTGARGR
jgi:hypothetical protein